MSRRDWTPEAARALGVRTDLVIACDLVYGCGKNTAYEKYRAGTLDFPVIRCGRRLIVPVAPLLALLGLDQDDRRAATPPGGPASVPDASIADIGRGRRAASGHANRSPGHAGGPPPAGGGPRRLDQLTRPPSPKDGGSLC